MLRKLRFLTFPPRTWRGEVKIKPWDTRDRVALVAFGFASATSKAGAGQRSFLPITIFAKFK